MARQRSKRPREDGPSPPGPRQENTRAKREKTGRQQHQRRSKRLREDDPSPPSPQQDSQQEPPRAKRAKTGRQQPQRRSKRLREDDPSPPSPQQDSQQEPPRAKRAKRGRIARQSHPQVQTSPSLLQDKHPVDRTAVDLLPTNEEEHSHIAVARQPSPEPKTDHHQTIPPAPPGTDTRLTRENLAKLNRMTSNLPSNDTFRPSGPTRPTTIVSASHRSSNAYTNGFPSILQASGIHMNGNPSMLADLQELRRERSVRPSLAPSEFPDSKIERVFGAYDRAASEADVERDAVAAIVGFWDHLDFPHSSNIAWSNMSSMTGKRTVDPRPDLFYGTRIEDIAKEIRDEIGHLIQPSQLLTAPVAPHFVMEVKGPAGRYDILERQAAHSAAAAARAACALENFGLDEPKYDDTTKAHAWTFSSPGILTHYGVRVSRPEPGSLEPSYHLTLIDAYFIRKSVDEFRKGVSAFRHCREESHAKNQARLAEAHERLRRRSQQTRQETGQQTTQQVPGSTLSPGPLPESHPGPELNPSVENDTPSLDQQLQQDCEARSPDAEAAPGPSSPSAAAAVITTSMPPPASTNVTRALPHDGAPSSKKKTSVSNRPSNRPQRTRRRPKRFGMLDS